MTKVEQLAKLGAAALSQAMDATTGFVLIVIDEEGEAYVTSDMNPECIAEALKDAMEASYSHEDEIDRPIA